MASGTPVVTVNHGPLPEMVDDSVGSLFELGDIMGLSRAINLELANPQKRRVKGLAGRDRVMSAFTFDKNAEDFEKIYSSQPSE